MPPGSPIVLSGVRAINNAAEANCIAFLAYSTYTQCRLAQYKSLLEIATKAPNMRRGTKILEKQRIFCPATKESKIIFPFPKNWSKENKSLPSFPSQVGRSPFKNSRRCQTIRNLRSPQARSGKKGKKERTIFVLSAL